MHNSEIKLLHEILDRLRSINDIAVLMENRNVHIHETVMEGFERGVLFAVHRYLEHGSICGQQTHQIAHHYFFILDVEFSELSDDAVRESKDARQGDREFHCFLIRYYLDLSRRRVALQGLAQ